MLKVLKVKVFSSSLPLSTPLILCLCLQLMCTCLGITDHTHLPCTVVLVSYDLLLRSGGAHRTRGRGVPLRRSVVAAAADYLGWDPHNRSRPAAVSALRSILIGRQDIAVYFPPPRLASKLLLIPLLATLVSLLNTMNNIGLDI